MPSTPIPLRAKDVSGTYQLTSALFLPDKWEG